ncbi:MAG TPA: hypothetical protein VF230_04490 [Acidimicrobiales bacterium]
MVRPTPRRLSPFGGVALGIAAVAVVAAGVQFGTSGLPRSDQRSPASSVSNPAAEVVVPVRLATVAREVEDAPELAPSRIDATAISPASVPGPQSVPAPGPSDGATTPSLLDPAPTPPGGGEDPGTDPGLLDPLVEVVAPIVAPAADVVHDATGAGLSVPAPSVVVSGL